MKRAMIVLGVLILVGLAGCGKNEEEKSKTVESEKEHIGKYVYEKQFGTALRTEILEIKNDGTYNLTIKVSGAFAVPPQIFTGRWKIDEDRILLSDDDGSPRMMGELKENTLINRLSGGEIYTKQN